MTLQYLKRRKERLVPFVYNCMRQKSEPVYLELHVVLFCFQNDINGRLYEVAYFKKYLTLVGLLLSDANKEVKRNHKFQPYVSYFL